MKRFFYVALTAVGALSACATDPGFVPVSGVREISQAEATQCSYISDFRMTPPVYGPLAGQGLRYARNKVMADARDAGANAVVFDPVTPGADVYAIHAVGYRC